MSFHHVSTSYHQWNQCFMLNMVWKFYREKFGSGRVCVGTLISLVHTVQQSCPLLALYKQYSAISTSWCISTIAGMPYNVIQKLNPPLRLSVSVSLQELSRVHAHEVLAVSWWEVHPGREQSSVWLHPRSHSLLHHKQTAHPRSRAPVSALPGAGADALRPHTLNTRSRTLRA